MHRPLLFLCERWAVVTLSVLVAAHIVPGIQYDSPAGLLAASLVLGLLNTFLRPVLLFLSLPLLVLSLGFFLLILNALLLYWVGALVKSFHVDSFGAAFLGALVISLVSLGVNHWLGKAQARRLRRNPRPQQDTHTRDPDQHGPIIDV
jgi:putative membrane protein